MHLVIWLESILSTYSFNSSYPALMCFLICQIWTTQWISVVSLLSDDPNIREVSETIWSELKLGILYYRYRDEAPTTGRGGRALRTPYHNIINWILSRSEQHTCCLHVLMRAIHSSLLLKLFLPTGLYKFTSILEFHLIQLISFKLLTQSNALLEFKTIGNESNLNFYLYGQLVSLNQAQRKIWLVLD